MLKEKPQKKHYSPLREASKQAHDNHGLLWCPTEKGPLDPRGLAQPK
jgi:hypothetical protein